MKRLYVALMAALLCCGMAWADGKITGKVTAPGQGADFCNGVKIYLTNDDEQLITEVSQDGSYMFSNVPEGTYTLSCQQQAWGSTTLYAGEETVTVTAGTLTQDLVLNEMEGIYYTLNVKPIAEGESWKQIVGARISSEEQKDGKGTGKIERRTVTEQNGDNKFYCKAGVEYEIVVKASEYKTHKEKLTLTASMDGAWDSKKINMVKGEDETEAGNAQLTGTVAVEGGGQWPSGVYIALTDASNELLSLVADLSGGTYSFPNVKLGAAVKFHLTTDLLNPTTHPNDYTFVEGGSEVNPIEFTMPANAGTEAVVTKDLTVRYKGNAPATLLGRALSADGNCLYGVQVTINPGAKSATTTSKSQKAFENDFDCDGLFEFTNVAAGDYTLTYGGKDFYQSGTQSYTVVVTGANQTLKVPDITLYSKSETVTFNGTLQYQGEDGEDVVVSGATIMAYSSENGGSVLGSATTAADGTWTMELICALNDMVYFDASHASITVENRAFCKVASTQAYINITCTKEQDDVEKVMLTLNSNNDAWGSVSGAGEYVKGRSATAMATPGEGYEFVAWKEGETQVSTANPYTFTINADRTLTAVFAEKTDEKVTLTLNPNNANWGSVSGAGEYDKGAQATATATPNANYKFVAWKEGETQVSTVSAYTFVINADRTLEAVFVPDSAVLTVKPNYPERGSVDGGGKFAKGQEVTVTATANDGFEFGGWRNNQGATVNMANPYTFTLTGTLTLTAYFRASDPNIVPDSATLTLTVNNAAMGTAAARDKVGGAKFEAGETVEITATPNTGYRFVEWQENGTQLSTENPYEVEIAANTDRTIMAVFAEQQTPPEPPVEETVTLALDASPAAGGSVSQSGNGTYTKGTSVTVTATPNENYKFVAWKEGETQVSTDNPYTFTLDAARELTAVFAELPPVVMEKDSFNLRLQVNDVAMGTVEGMGRYEEGTEVTIKAIANEGYEFRAWMEGDEVVAMEAEHTLVVNADRELTAMFAAKTQPPTPPVANEDSEQAAWRAYAENGQIVLCGNTACQYDVYNMAGVLVKHATTQANECRIVVENSGMYIVRRITSTGISVKKVMVR